MTETPPATLSPRYMWLLANWVLHHEYANKCVPTLHEVASRASLDLGIMASQADLLTAYESVAIKWRPKPLDEEADAETLRNKDLAAIAEGQAEMADVLAAVCGRMEEAGYPILSHTVPWAARKRTMTGIAGRFSHPDE